MAPSLAWCTEPPTHRPKVLLLRSVRFPFSATYALSIIGTLGWPASVCARSPLSALTSSYEYLALSPDLIGRPFPLDWHSRAVRGQQSPQSLIVADTERPAWRIAGAGTGAWFYRDLRRDAPARIDVLRVEFRILAAPVDADLSRPDRSDAALRFYVIWEDARRLLPRRRLVFFSYGNTTGGTSRIQRRNDMCDIHRPATASNTWRIDTLDFTSGARESCGWEAGRVVAVGLMQDTDQTKSVAVVEIRTITRADR